MKKARFCRITSLILCLSFLGKTLMDYQVYSTTLNSAPFSLWIAVNALYFLLPAAIFLAAGLLLGRKGRA